MKNILITGITGFIGRNIVDYFSGSDDIRIFGHSRDLPNAKKLFGENQVEFLSELSSTALDKSQIDIIIHLAGIAHDLSGQYQAEDYDKINNIGTRKLYDQFLDSKTSIFVFISSIKAVVDHSGALVDENTDPKPSSAYGISKLKAEKYMNQHHRKDKRYYTLRPCMVHGPGNKGNLNLLYKYVKTGLPFPLGAFDNQRSFLSIDNFCYVIDKILHNQLKPGTYFLSDDQKLSTNQLVRLISNATNRKVSVLKIPRPLIYFLANLGSILHLPFNKSNISKLTENLTVSNKKLLLNLGSNLPVTAEEGLIKTIKSFNE